MPDTPSHAPSAAANRCARAAMPRFHDRVPTHGFHDRPTPRDVSDGALVHNIGDSALAHDVRESGLPQDVSTGDPPNDLHARALMRDLLAVGARLGAVRDGLAARLGLPGAAFSVLTALAALEAEGASPGIVTLAQHLGLSPTFVTAEVARLERCQLVEKRPHPTDRRRIVLRLSGRASAALAALAPAERPVHAALFAGLDAAAATLLGAMLQNLLADAEQALQLLAGAPAAA